MRTPGGGMQEWLLRLCPEWLDTWGRLEAGGSSLTWGTLQALVEGWILFDRDLERVRIETAVRHPPLKANLATALTFFGFILIPSCCCSFLPLVTPNLCILKMWCKSLLADEWCAGALGNTHLGICRLTQECSSRFPVSPGAFLPTCITELTDTWLHPPCANLAST